MRPRLSSTGTAHAAPPPRRRPVRPVRLDPPTVVSPMLPGPAPGSAARGAFVAGSPALGSPALGSAAFAQEGGPVVLARVRGRALARAGLRDGDHVFFERWVGGVGPGASALRLDGAIASVVDRSGRGALWRVRRDRDALALYDGPLGGAAPAPVARTGPWPLVQGVVVGILRKFDVGADGAASASRGVRVPRTPADAP